MNVELLMALIEIATKAAAAIQQIKKDDPAAYEAVAKHHADALSRAEAAKDV